MWIARFPTIFQLVRVQCRTRIIVGQLERSRRYYRAIVNEISFNTFCPTIHNSAANSNDYSDDSGRDVVPNKQLKPSRVLIDEKRVAGAGLINCLGDETKQESANSDS
jgi:hypothetical protein